MSDLLTRRISIDGMHCSSCVMALNWALEDIEGVHEVDTSYAANATNVTYDPMQVDEEAILAAIRGAGYGGTFA